jgi:hypothetical protein
MNLEKEHSNEHLYDDLLLFGEPVSAQFHPLRTWNEHFSLAKSSGESNKNKVEITTFCCYWRNKIAVACSVDGRGKNRFFTFWLT